MLEGENALLTANIPEMLAIGVYGPHTVTPLALACLLGLQLLNRILTTLLLQLV